MLLTEIRDYLQLVRRATLQDVARHFKMPESALEPMLLFWVRKGLLRQHEMLSNCAIKGCSGCAPGRMPASCLYVYNDEIKK